MTVGGGGQRYLGDPPEGFRAMLYDDLANSEEVEFLFTLDKMEISLKSFNTYDVYNKTMEFAYF